MPAKPVDKVSGEEQSVSTTPKPSGRPKGYAEWNPAPATREIIEQVEEILHEYREYGPMTARQVFYRLVGQHGYDKTEKAYKRLTGYLVRARRAELVDFGSIRDDGSSVMGGGGWRSGSEFWRGVRATAKHFRLDRQMNQPVSIELWCEAAGMAPMLSRMVREWDVPVYSTGGFSSVTVTHEAAQRIAYRETPTIFLHMGDYDPSGESIFNSMSQDIGAFVAEIMGGELYEDGEVMDMHDHPWFTPVRVALKDWQVETYDLPTAPPKASDSRSANWDGETTQLEAMPPSLIEEILLDEVKEHVDDSALRDTLRREQEEKESIMEVLELTGE